ncbi:hypothetical protein CC2G_007857 [Coprinopsis cinerea AmutBmut pab1-1]|nr:hypothetical protein CC2G_007857 [Coprinopsis cinerea AmutBmut pab1-1]
MCMVKSIGQLVGWAYLNYMFGQVGWHNHYMISLLSALSVASQQLLPASTSNAPPPPPPPQASTSAAPNPPHHPAALPQPNIPQFGTPGLDMASLFQMVADQLNKGGASSR